MGNVTLESRLTRRKRENAQLDEDGLGDVHVGGQDWRQTAIVLHEEDARIPLPHVVVAASETAGLEASLRPAGGRHVVVVLPREQLAGRPVAVRQAQGDATVREVVAFENGLDSTGDPSSLFVGELHRPAEHQVASVGQQVQIPVKLQATERVRNGA